MHCIKINNINIKTHLLRWFMYKVLRLYCTFVDDRGRQVDSRDSSDFIWNLKKLSVEWMATNFAFEFQILDNNEQWLVITTELVGIRMWIKYVQISKVLLWLHLRGSTEKIHVIIVCRWSSSIQNQSTFGRLLLKRRWKILLSIDPNDQRCLE